MLHEVLLSLLGHPGSIIQEEPAISTTTGGSASDGLKSGSTFRVPDTITFLTATERAAINRVVGIGSIYRDLRKFVRPKALLWEEGGSSASGIYGSSGHGSGEGLYLRALKVGVVEVLDEYAERVAEVERDVMADPTLTLARVYAGVREYTSILPAVAEACVAVAGDREQGRLKGSQVLEILHERSHFGAPDVRRRLCRLVWHCSQVLMNQCVSWLLHGLVVDPCGEFWVQKNAQPAASATRNSGIPALSAGLDEPGNERHAAFEEGLEAASRRVDDWGGEEEWNSTYTVRLALVPTTFVPHRLAQKMLFVGKVVRVLRQASPQVSTQHRAPFAGLPSESGVKGDEFSSHLPANLWGDGVAAGDGSGGMGVSEAEVMELTQRWSELCDRESFNLLALERAVHEAHALVDRRLYRLLMNVSGLEKHLSSLKGLFLMGHGALFHSFFDKAREAMRTPAGDRAVLDLNMWLAAAAEDNEGGHASLTSSESILSRVVIALDPSGFTCKAFHDLTRQGFCVTGRARHSPKKSTVCLCPGGPDAGSRSKRPVSSLAPPEAEAKSKTAGGSLWYASDRELPRGFTSSVAFRCDRPQFNAKGSAGEEKASDPVGGSGSVSFVVHNHRLSLAAGGEGGGERWGESAAVPNSLSVRLEPDGHGGGQILLRWNPHLSPSLSTTETSAPLDVGSVPLDNPSLGRGSGLRTLGRAALPRSCGLHLGQVNYLMVDYALGELRPARKPAGESDEAASSRKDSRPSARLRVFVNDPGRSGSASLSVPLDLWALIEMAGGRAFVGVSAEGPWRTTLRQWDFRLGSAAVAGQVSGPLGGVGSGPQVEKMVEAMDSWNGLCLDYMLEWPLHLILTRETMQIYNRLFRLLASVKRTSLELERVWPTLMQRRYRGETNNEKAWLGPLWMLRARMAFFVSNLAFYLQVDVVEAAHTVLKSKLETVRDFVSLQRAHQEMLSTLRAKFFLDNLDISQGLGRALRHVLRFCCLFAVHGDAKDIIPAEVTSLHQAFQDEMKILIPVLERLAKELAMRLDFNGHFSADVL